VPRTSAASPSLRAHIACHLELATHACCACQPGRPRHHRACSLLPRACRPRAWPPTRARHVRTMRHSRVFLPPSLSMPLERSGWRMQQLGGVQWLHSLTMAERTSDDSSCHCTLQNDSRETRLPERLLSMCVPLSSMIRSCVPRSQPPCARRMKSSAVRSLHPPSTRFDGAPTQASPAHAQPAPEGPRRALLSRCVEREKEARRPTMMCVR
jgi:hypothetical protein